jgi:hypothetical protein
MRPKCQGSRPLSGVARNKDLASCPIGAGLFGDDIIAVPKQMQSGTPAPRVIVSAHGAREKRAGRTPDRCFSHEFSVAEVHPRNERNRLTYSFDGSLRFAGGRRDTSVSKQDPVQPRTSLKVAFLS